MSKLQINVKWKVGYVKDFYMVKFSFNRALGKLLKKPPIMIPATLALRTVISRSGHGVYASSDTLFRGAVFGRDSLVVAEDLMTLKPQLVKRILLFLASMQGLEHRSANEEEPGKIIHEFRARKVDGRTLSGTPLKIFETLSSRWGGNQSELIYYGSVDSTPQFIRTLCEYFDFYGPRFLRHKITNINGQQATVYQIMVGALAWLEDKLERSHSGLLEYHAHNRAGIANQVWKDSKEFYVHENGRLVNHDRPVASIEVQGLVYDALIEVSKYLPERAELLKQTAENVRDKTLKLLWRPAKKYFALGCDFDQQGKLRLIKTTTANPASLLNSGIFDALADKSRQKYISGIVRNIMGSDFLTDAGVRSRGLSEAGLIPFWDYHGSYVSWPKETYDIAKGLRRQGFNQLATQLENRLLNVVKKSRGYPEFLYVDPRGRVLGSSSNAHRHTHALVVRSTNAPESIQAWTVSAILAISANRRPGLKTAAAKPEHWQVDLEQEVLAHIPRVTRLKTVTSLNARYPDYPYKLTKEHF